MPSRREGQECPSCFLERSPVREGTAAKGPSPSPAHPFWRSTAPLLLNPEKPQGPGTQGTPAASGESHVAVCSRRMSTARRGWTSGSTTLERSYDSPGNCQFRVRLGWRDHEGAVS